MTNGIDPSDRYTELIAAYKAIPSDEWKDLGDALFTMILEGPPASVEFLQRVILDVVSPIQNDEPLPGVADIEEALDAIPSDEFISLALVLAEMGGSRPEASAAFLRVLGRMFGESIRRRNVDIDPETQAFANVIVGYFMDVGGQE